MSNPYTQSRDYQLWRRSVSKKSPYEINPVVSTKFKILSDDRVGTAGSCFAQHIAGRIEKIGFNYYCPEHDRSLPPEQARQMGYGIFSARYGNIYTVHQLNQLFLEATGAFQRSEVAWEKSGRYFDPYRPTIFPDGFETPEQVTGARKIHLGHVRQVFSKSDVFVFTLGLTESWRSKEDGAVFPLAPGVAAGAFDPRVHEFHNYSIDEVRSELFSFLSGIGTLNPGVKILLTVSPVPLIATYEDRHVLSSTIYSKSVLRVAAQEACDRFENVDYFPSYEIITGSPTGGLYYEDDMREVNRHGVNHAMRCFVAAYTQGAVSHGEAPIEIAERGDAESAFRIVCDEEEIDKSASRP